MWMRIGYEHPDSLVTYPDAHSLSGCVHPIRMCPRASVAVCKTPFRPDSTRGIGTMRSVIDPVCAHLGLCALAYRERARRQK